MKLTVTTMITVIACLIGSMAAASTRVAVGVYHFPPVVSVPGYGHVSGLLADVLDELNTRQSDYTFEVVKTSPKRRYLDFENGRFDAIFFESENWGWQDIDHETTPPILVDEDVYVALRKPGRDQSFFDDLKERHLVGMLGYHYGFAGLDASERMLRQKFDIVLSYSHSRNIELILADRPTVAEIAIVSRSYLQLYLRENPANREWLLISDKVDQRYELPVLTRPGSPLSAGGLMTLLIPLFNDGTYQTLVRAHGLQLPPAFTQLP